MDSKPLIFICVTSMGTIVPQLAQSLIYWCQNTEHNIKVYFCNRVQPLDNARNHCVNEFMKISKNDDDRLFFIDDDMVFAGNSLDVLINHDKDIVALLYFMAKPDDNGYLCPLPIACRHDENKDYKLYMEGQGLTEIDATGGGAIMIKRKVFKDIGQRPYQYIYNKDGSLALVADFNFCRKAQEKGYKIYIDFDNHCGHLKQIDLREYNRFLNYITYENSKSKSDETKN